MFPVTMITEEVDAIDNKMMTLLTFHCPSSMCLDVVDIIYMTDLQICGPLGCVFQYSCAADYADYEIGCNTEIFR